MVQLSQKIDHSMKNVFCLSIRFVFEFDKAISSVWTSIQLQDQTVLAISTKCATYSCKMHH